MAGTYKVDRSLAGKLRRRAARLVARRAAGAPTRPMVSFTFDDAPATAAQAGARILEGLGLRGTYFIAASLAGQDSPSGPILAPAAAARLAESGHEIACHTFSHLDCGRSSAAEIDADVERNCAALAAWGLAAPVTFAFPYGDLTIAAKRVLGARFALSRALHHGLIGRGADLNQAPAVGIEGPGGERTAQRWLAQAAARRAWLILYTHDVREDSSPWGCAPATLERLAEAALAAQFEVVTVAEGARRLRQSR
ncbi:MAG: polysaccharide deacetylase family protein [Caulobacteraceae bacterium]|nr:polysaccharide deacetylase family protein [Caulobacteraceae bacterium]